MLLRGDFLLRLRQQVVQKNTNAVIPRGGYFGLRRKLWDDGAVASARSDGATAGMCPDLGADTRVVNLRYVWQQRLLISAVLRPKWSK